MDFFESCRDFYSYKIIAGGFMWKRWFYALHTSPEEKCFGGKCIDRGIDNKDSILLSVGDIGMFQCVVYQIILLFLK